MSLITFENARIEALSVHWVGNRSIGEPIIISRAPQQLIDDKVHYKLLQFFLNNFKDRLLFEFTGNQGSEQNELKNIAGEIFDEPSNLHQKSGEIAHLLYNVSTHHWIKNGECWVAYFSNIKFGDQISDAIGIFKTELKDEFLTIKRTGDGFVISLNEGFNIKKIDKGCLIMNTPDDKEYEIQVIDNINLQDPAEYWKGKFLGIKPVNNAYLNTSNELKILKAFLEESLPENDKLERVEKLNNSVHYLNDNDRFKLPDFGSNVFPEKELRKSYNDFRNQYKADLDVEIEDEYDIEHEVVKNPKKYVRGVIKLDKDFHIYVHGSRRNIVRGYDKEKGMNYYQIFFSEET
jgi:hypothetical protein